MAENYIDDEKPNLRPIKRNSASGKTIFLHHNPNDISNESYIHALWNNTNTHDPFGITEPRIKYSLNKQNRWKILNEFREQIADDDDDDDDDDLNTKSDDEQYRKNSNLNKRKYRLYEYHNVEQKSNCIRITTNTGQQHTQIPQKTYMETTKIKQNENHQNTNQLNDALNTIDVMYFAVTPPPREKHLVNVRKTYETKRKQNRINTQRTKLNQIKQQFEHEQDDLSADDENDEDEQSTTSDENFFTPVQLKLNDFIRTIPIDNDKQITKSDEINKSSNIDFNENDSIKSKKRFHRYLSREEQLYNRDMETYLKTKPVQNQTTEKATSTKPLIASLTFQKVFLYKNDFTVEYLSKTFGKNFFHAQCYPTKYLICLTDRVKSLEWEDKFKFFPIYSTLNCYLIIVLNDDLNTNEDQIEGEISVNMDLNFQTIYSQKIFNSDVCIYTINQLINRTIGFVTNLSFNKFKPIDYEIHRRNMYHKQLDENEYLNKQIEQVKLFDKNEQINNYDTTVENYVFIPSDICINCYTTTDQLTSMTALKSCGHWLCNECWKQYLEYSIKHIKVIRCPEWNCSSFVDMGTILSLVNVRYMNIYERNLEKCLVNLSRSFVKCPSKSCQNIVQVDNLNIDNVRCRCGHQFCIDCKQEPHFPATCNSYRGYIEELRRNGDLASNPNSNVVVHGRPCVSCNNFIEKNGGCNHMTCRCGAEFCWTCTGYWKDHYSADGAFRCPKHEVSMQKRIIRRERNPNRTLYEYAIYHRHERDYRNQTKFNKNVKRLIGTIPLDKGTLTDSSVIKSQIDKREALLRHGYEMVKYVNYLHGICEFVAVSADGYANNPVEFTNSLTPLETLVTNICQILECGRGYKAIEQLNDLHKKSEKYIERLRYAVNQRRNIQNGYRTS